MNNTALAQNDDSDDDPTSVFYEGHRADQVALARMIRGTADPHTRLETFPEYLRRLADDCEESGNTGHAADHRASAGAIDLLAGALVGFLCIDDWNTEEIAPRALVERARAAIENIQTVENALE